MAASFRGSSESTISPSTVTWPVVGVKMQPRIERRVVFPEPDGPSSVTISPGSRASATPRSTGTDSRPSRNVLTTARASMTGMRLTAKDQCRVDLGHLAERNKCGNEAKDQGPDQGQNDEH